MVLSLDRWIGKVAIVTGASSGIGVGIAESLVKEGLIVVGVARRKDRLEQLATKLTGHKGKFHPVVADIAKENDILKAFAWIKENLGPIHVLINNAGIVKRGVFLEQTTEQYESVFKVNVIGLSIATREAIKDMRANNVDGHIVHINSVAGHQVYVGSQASVYSSSKFAVTALAETLRLELNSLKSKIKITSLSPGVVESELNNPAWDIPTWFKEGKIIKPEDIADGVVYALSTPPHVQIQELTIRPVLDPF